MPLLNYPEVRERSISLYVNVNNPQSAIRNLQFDLPKAWRVRAIPFPRLWTHLRLSWEMMIRAPGTLFVPSHVVPLWHPRHTVVTVHDLGYLEYPQAHKRFSWLYLHLSTWFSAHAASKVIAISEATKRDLIKHYKIEPSKIEVIYHGRDPIFTPVTDQTKIDTVLAKYGVTPAVLHPRRYIAASQEPGHPCGSMGYVARQDGEAAAAFACGQKGLALR